MFPTAFLTSWRADPWPRTCGLWFFSLLMLTGCGFQPVYQQSAETEALAAFLSNIRIQVNESPQRTRTGQLLQHELEDLLYSTDNPNKPYVLSILLSTSQGSVLINPDGQIARYNYRASSEFSLTSITHPDEQYTPLLSGTTQSVVTYNVVPSDFATYIAQKDAKKRLAREVAEEIRNRLVTAYYDKPTLRQDDADQEAQ